jgi:hypothetical protein
MRFRSAIAGAILLASGASSASATMLISEDRGGQIGQYLQAFASLRSSGEHVVIDGNCFSACTLVLGLIPRERICATSRARLGFHAAWMPDDSGRPVTSPMGTQALWNIYPHKVRSWIGRHGGLTRKMLFLQGDELASIVPSCGAPSKVAAKAATTKVAAKHSKHRALPRIVRYGTASAASTSR